MADDSYKFTFAERRRETVKAFLYEILSNSFWVPKSQILNADPKQGILVTTLWWAEVSGAKYIYEQAKEARTATLEPELTLATAGVIYRRLALKYHPDRNPDAEEFMTDLNQLWQAVKTDLKK
jgi:hypothetical protein